MRSYFWFGHLQSMGPFMESKVEGREAALRVGMSLASDNS